MEPLILSLMRRSENQLHLCVSFILLWIASSDGELHEHERDFLFKHMESVNKDTYSELKVIIDRQDIGSFIVVCGAINSALDESLKESLLMISISIAIADNRLAISEIQILHLLADLVGYSPVRLQVLYKGMTGVDFPSPGDPGSVAWWQSKQKKKRKSNNERQQSRSHSGVSRDEAFVILGLNISATQDDIRRAYKRLVQAHHPDRFSALGPDAADAAHAMFVRIQQAYKMLSK